MFDLDPIGQLQSYRREERELKRRLEVIRQLRDTGRGQPHLHDRLLIRVGDWLIDVGLRLRARVSLDAACCG